MPVPQKKIQRLQRLQFDVTDEEMAEIDQMVIDSEAKTRAEMDRKARRIYKYIISLKKKGTTFAIKNPDGTYTDVIIIF